MAANLPIYMDHQATTPVDPRVLAAMLPFFGERYGNAASRTHAFGRTAAAACEEARARVAALIGAEAAEIVWTSGATESNNLAIKGIFAFHRGRGDHVVTAETEHRAVLDPCRQLERQGARLTVVPVERDGRVSPDAIANAMTDSTVLVSVMLANNEIGTVNPVQQIGAAVKQRGAFFHIDAAQGAGKVPFAVDAAQADLVSLSAHKMYGPKGVGALYVRRRPRITRLTPLIDGGGHERGLRSGTLNVPGIVGFGVAAQLSGSLSASEGTHLRRLGERLRAAILAGVPDAVVNGSLDHRLPGNLNLSFPGVDADSLLVRLADVVAVSSGAACSSAEAGPSHVLRALGVDPELARATVRFGIGRFNTEEEVDRVADAVVRHARALRSGRDQAGVAGDALH